MYYTSARSGLENRAGFQFVAASREARALQPTVAPYLAYRPPPSAPARPTAAELENLPVALSYQREGDNLILVQCRYVGTDYSGRYGNFLGHAVVAEPRELGGLRPIELWGSRVWASSVDDPAPALPDLTDTDLSPGPLVEPEAILLWLGARGEPAYRLMAALLDAVLASLDRSGGQVVLVSDQVETIVHWIAAVSYSIPHGYALDLSFVTYTADPDRARQHVIGTTPDSVVGVRADARVFDLDRGLSATASATPSRYTEAVAAGWRRGSFDLLDELHDLIEELTDGRDQHRRDAAAAVFTLSRGLMSIDRDEDAASVAGLIERCAERLPPSVWAGLGEQSGARLGAVVAAALCGAAQRTGRHDLADRIGAECVALALGDPRLPAPAVRRLSAARREGLAHQAGVALRDAATVADLVHVLRIARDLGLAVRRADLHKGAAHAVQSGVTHAVQGNGAQAVPAGAAQAVPAGGGDLAAAYNLLASAEDRASLLDGVVDGLANADPAHLRAMLTPALCDRLADRDWLDAPRVGAYVLTSYGQRRREKRVGITGTLVDLADVGGLSDSMLDRHVAQLWAKGRPNVSECLRLLGPHGLLDLESRARPCIVGLARVALAHADIQTSETAALASIVVDVVGSGNPLAADAEAVIAFHELAAGELAVGCERLERARAHASAAMVNAVSRQAQMSLLGAPPRHQADALLRLPGGSSLRRTLVTTLVQRRRRDVDLLRVDLLRNVTSLVQGGRVDLLRNVTALVQRRRRPADQGADLAKVDVDLAEVAARLWLGGAPDAKLSAVIASRTRYQVEAMRSRLSRRDKNLAEGFDKLRAGAKPAGLLSRFWRGGTGA
jgi:hypothetical protein